MRYAPPKLHKHATGQWFIKFAGKTHYLGKDHRAAKGRYVEKLQQWAAWSERRTQAVAAVPAQCPRLVDLVEQFLDAVETQGGRSLRKYYRSNLKRFTHAYALARADQVRAIQIEGLKQDMAREGYAPKTINHTIGSAKTLLQWAMDLEMIPAVNLRGCKPMPLMPPKNKALSVDEVRTWIGKAPQPIQSWLAVNYFTMARPVEIVRAVHGKGQWEEPWLLRLEEHKMARRSRQPRYLLFSDEAREWFSACRPIWNQTTTYDAASQRTTERTPGVLRHSGATHLSRLGVARADVDLILGHWPTRVSLTYQSIEFERLLQSASRLTLRPDVAPPQGQFQPAS